MKIGNYFFVPDTKLQGRNYAIIDERQIKVCPFIYESIVDPDTREETLEILTVKKEIIKEVSYLEALVQLQKDIRSTRELFRSAT